MSRLLESSLFSFFTCLPLNFICPYSLILARGWVPVSSIQVSVVYWVRTGVVYAQHAYPINNMFNQWNCVVDYEYAPPASNHFHFIWASSSAWILLAGYYAYLTNIKHKKIRENMLAAVCAGCVDKRYSFVKHNDTLFSYFLSPRRMNIKMPLLLEWYFLFSDAMCSTNYI